MFSKVKSIKKINKTDNCYDIQVENTSCYYSNDILSHNSALVVDSIVYALFGKTTKKIKADKAINNINDKDCFVELSFNIQNDVYIIRRYRKHTQFENNLVIEKNGVTSNDSDQKRSTQKLIENIIKISFKSFVLSIVLSQEKVANFAEVDPLERKRIIENLLMYDFISKYHRADKQIMRKIKPTIERLTSQYVDKKEVVKTLTNNLLKYIDTWENNIGLKKNKIANLKKEIEEWKNLNLTEELNNRNLLKRRIEEKETLEDKTSGLTEYIAEILEKIKNARKNKVLRTSKIDKYLLNPEDCPVCGNSINSERFQKFIYSENEEVKKLTKEIDELIEKEKELKKKLNRKEKRLKYKSEEINQLRESINDDLSEDDIQNINDKITGNESEIKVLQEQIDIDIEKDEYIINTQKEIDKVKLDSEHLRRKIRRHEEELSYFEWWKDALSNSPNSMKSFCINHILKSLNKYINYYLSFFKFDIQYKLDENLDDNLVKDGKEYTFGQLSRGEKRTVEISLLFALYETIRLKMPDEINLIVLDELLSNFLDDVRIEGALNILQELEERGFDIFVIEHKEIIKESLMCNTLNVIKDQKGFSILETTS